jgi:Formin Homology 2 Domain
MPVSRGIKKDEKPSKEEDSHRRARLHWKTLRKVTSNSLWAQIDQDGELDRIQIDEDEFQELFQEEKGSVSRSATKSNFSGKRGSTVCVIDSKRANNGGIILARLKMSHDDLADAVDRIDERPLSAEQIENIIEYLPTKEERRALEAYMLEGGQDAAEKFDCLCECEKFMVSMMTVKHAKRKLSALLFKLQFETCLQDIQKEADLIGNACLELTHSVRLRLLLGYVLSFGNRLNTAGNGKRKAGAFTLDSLLKLNQAKAFDKKTTFLHYIVLIVRRNNDSILSFKEDLPSVFAAEKVFWDQCVADLDEVENQLENLRKIALYQAHQNQGYRLRQRKKSSQDQDESFSDCEIVLTLE